MAFLLPVALTPSLVSWMALTSPLHLVSQHINRIVVMTFINSKNRRGSQHLLQWYQHFQHQWLCLAPVFWFWWLELRLWCFRWPDCWCYCCCSCLVRHYLVPSLALPVLHSMARCSHPPWYLEASVSSAICLAFGYQLLTYYWSQYRWTSLGWNCSHRLPGLPAVYLRHVPCVCYPSGN